MKIKMLALLVAIWPAVMASAQIGPRPENPAGQPGQFEQGDRGEGGFRRFGPPPNPMFTAIDVDGDGVITKAELRKAVAALKKLDTDGDGSITLAEVTPASPFSDPAAFVERMITENDKNGDGKLTADEIPERMQRMVEDADQDGNGELTKEELTAAMENMRNRFRGGRGRDGFRGGQDGGRGRDRDSDATAQFMQFDTNRDGRLTANEVPQQAMGALQGGDQNGDGAIDAAELQAIIARMGDRARAIGAGAGPGGDPNTFRDPNRRDR